MPNMDDTFEGSQVPAKSQSIYKIISDIDEKRLYLPEFQRDFVWTLDKTIDLFDSIVRRIHIGSLIYGTPTFAITVRDINTAPRKQGHLKKGNNTNIHELTTEEIKRHSGMQDGIALVLDGQQRLTSLYRAIKGIDEVWYIMKSGDEYLDNFKTKELTLEDLLERFSEKEDPERICVKISDVVKYRREDDDIIYELFDNSLYGMSISDEIKHKKSRSAYKYILRELDRWFEYPTLVSYFLLHMSGEKFALFFERSNSRGMKLNYVDILVAKLYCGFNLRENIQEFNLKHDYEMSPDISVRAVAYFVSGGKCIDMTYVLNELKPEHFVDGTGYWKAVTEAYEDVVEYLRRNHYIDTIEDLPYSNMILTLIAFACTLPRHSLNNMNENERKVIDWWYWSTAFSKHYTDASNEAIIRDCNCLRALRNEALAEPRIERFFSDLHPKFRNVHELENLIASRNPVYKGLLGVVRKKNNGILNWNHGEVLANAKLHDHHIFPQKYLQKKHVDDDDINKVVNHVIIYDLTNIAIKDQAPSEYLTKLKEEHQDIEETLTKCLIPDPAGLVSGYYDDNYDLFVEKRANLLFEYVEKHIFKQKELVEAYFRKTLSNN